VPAACGEDGRSFDLPVSPTGTPFGTIFGCAGVSRSRGRSIGTVRRQRADSCSQLPAGRVVTTVHFGLTGALRTRYSLFASGAPSMGTGVRVSPGRSTVTGTKLEHRFVKVRTMFFICFTIQWADGGTKSKGNYETIDIGQPLASGDWWSKRLLDRQKTAPVSLQNRWLKRLRPGRRKTRSPRRSSPMQPSEPRVFSSRSRFKSTAACIASFE